MATVVFVSHISLLWMQINCNWIIKNQRSCLYKKNNETVSDTTFGGKVDISCTKCVNYDIL